jgi:hypothetical protein
VTYLLVSVVGQGGGGRGIPAGKCGGAEGGGGVTCLLVSVVGRGGGG